MKLTPKHYRDAILGALAFPFIAATFIVVYMLLFVLSSA